MPAPLRRTLLALLLVSLLVPVVGFAWIELQALTEAEALHARDEQIAAAFEGALLVDAAAGHGGDPLDALPPPRADATWYVVHENGTARDRSGERPWPALRAVADDRLAGIEEMATPEGQVRSVAWARAPAADVLVVEVRPVIADQVAPPLAFVLVAIFATTGVAVIVSFIMLRVLRPIARLEAASRRLARGEWHERVPLDGPREVRALALAFNEMATSLQMQSDRLSRILDDRTRTLIDRESDLDALRFTLAHEFREPLRALRWIADDLLERRLDPDARDAALLVRQRIDAMDDVFRDLLRYEDVSRRPAPFTELDLTEVLAHARVAHGKEDALQVSVDPLPHVEGNESLLVSAFVEILENAATHARPRSGPSSLRVSTQTAEGEILLFFDDAGPGIPPARREDALHLFQRLRRDVPGTGAGFAIARRAIERHGGALSLDEAPGGGTRVIVRLPAPGTKAAAPPRREAPKRRF